MDLSRFLSTCPDPSVCHKEVSSKDLSFALPARLDFQLKSSPLLIVVQLMGLIDFRHRTNGSFLLVLFLFFLVAMTSSAATSFGCS